MITLSTIACPVCEGEHPAGPRLVGLVVIACDKLEPVGETRVFPLDGVIVAGAGLGVSEPRPKPTVEVERTQTAAELQAELDKRRPGQSRFVTQRREPDEVKVLSGFVLDDDEQDRELREAAAKVAQYLRKKAGPGK